MSIQIETTDEAGTTPSSLSRTIIEAVAAQEGVDPSELTVPLYDVIDPDSLNSLFTTPENGHQRRRGRVSFFYHGYTVTADSQGEIELREAEEK